MRELQADVAVIGGGLAGLSATRSLVSDGLDVVVLEARDRVGGRTLNHPIGDEKVVEVGGQWIGPGQDRVLALIRELGLQTFDTFTEGRNLFEHAGRLRPYRGEVPHVNPAALLDVQLALTRLERMARRVSAERPWTAPSATAWDSQTVASWTRLNMRTALGRALIGLACEAVWAADAADVSLLHFLAYARSGGGLQTLISTDGGAQQSRIVGGSQRIALGLADRLGEIVLTEEPVSTIDHGADVRVTARTVTVASTAGDRRDEPHACRSAALLTGAPLKA